MKLKYIIGILALLLLTVGTASAAIVVPVNYYKNDIGDTYPENVAITATFSGDTVTVKAAPVNGATTLPPNFDIQGIYLRVNHATGDTARNDDPSATGETWSYTGSSIPTLGNLFGVFQPVSAWEGKTNIKSGGPIVITHPNIESEIASVDGYKIVVKISWNGDLSNWVGGDTNIPEFPTVALPVAAILGLMFVFGRKKQE